MFASHDRRCVPAPAANDRYRPLLRSAACAALVKQPLAEKLPKSAKSSMLPLPMFLFDDCKLSGVHKQGARSTPCRYFYEHPVITSEFEV